MAEDKQQQRKPSGALAAEASPEEQAEWVERLNAMQLESLGSRRRDHISKADYKANRATPDWRTLEGTRRANQPGTEEWSAARERKAELSGWTNAFRELQNDGTAEEDLEDIAGGQTHRIKLAEAEAAARKGGDNSHEDPKSRHMGGYNATHGDRARGGGVIGTRERGDGRRGSARELASPPVSTPLGSFETLGARTRITGRDGSGRAKLAKPTTPVSTTAGSSNQSPASSRQTARGSVVNVPSRGQPLTSANRQVSTRSQRPSTSNYEAFLAAPETFMATYQSRLVGRQAVTAEDVSLSDAHASKTSSNGPRTASQEVVEPNASSSGERIARRESSIHSTTSLADSSIVFSPEIDSAPVGLRVPTPPPPGATTLDVSGERSYLIDLMGLDLREDVPAASRENAAEPPNVDSEDVEILNRSYPVQVTSSSDALSQLTLLLPSIRRELDPSTVAQLEALAARGLTQSPTGGSRRRTTSSVPSSSDSTISSPETTIMDTIGLSDSRFAQPTASSNRVSAGQLPGHVEGLRTAWTRNAEAGDNETAEVNPIIFGEHVYRSAATSKGSTAKGNSIASCTTVSNPFLPNPESALPRMPQVQSVGRSSPLSNPFQGTLEPASHRVSQVQPIANSYTGAREKPQGHSDTATERDGLSSHIPARQDPEIEGLPELGSLASPPLEGNLTHSVYASGGHSPARQQNFTIRARTSGSDHIIGEHLLPSSQRFNLGEGASHNVEVPIVAAHTRFISPAAHSPGTLRIIPVTAAAATLSTPEPLTLELSRLSLGVDGSEVAVGRRVADDRTIAVADTVGRSEPSISTSLAISQHSDSTHVLSSLLPASNPSRDGAPASISNDSMRAPNLGSSWDQVEERRASVSSHCTSTAVTATSSARYGNAGRGLSGYPRQQAPQLPAFLANNPPLSSDPGAAAARQYGLDHPRSPISSRPTLKRDDRGSVDLQASIYAVPYTGPPSQSRPTINSSGFLKPSDDVEPSNSSRGLRSKKDPWDVVRKHGSGS